MSIGERVANVVMWVFFAALLVLVDYKVSGLNKRLDEQLHRHQDAPIEEVENVCEDSEVTNRMLARCADAMERLAREQERRR